LTLTPPPHLVGFCAFSGTGKTTLLKRLIPLLKAADLRLAVVKHAHHSFDIDHPGKDSFEIRKAGADCTVVMSRKRIALIEELEDPRPEPRLSDALAALGSRHFDLIVVEGFKHERYPKIELHRPVLGHPLLYPNDRDIIAVATDSALQPTPPLPRLDINDPGAICAFVLARILD